jgi:Ku protein
MPWRPRPRAGPQTASKAFAKVFLKFEAIQIESTRTIDIDQFVPRSEIDERYIDSPYYIVPDGQVGQDAFAVIRDTIGKMNMVALGRVVLTRREHVIALEPRDRGLLGLTLRTGARGRLPVREGDAGLEAARRARS